MGNAQKAKPEVPDLAAAAEAITKATGVATTEEQIMGSRVESTGDLIVATQNGHKVRITTEGDVQVLMGAGKPTEDLFEPPELPAEPQDELPPLKAEGDTAGDRDDSADVFEVFKGEDKQWYVTQVDGGNHEPVMTSEAYKRLKDAMELAENLAAGREVRKL